jgi:hypothetical protein
MVIKYKKGVTNKDTDLLSNPLLHVIHILDVQFEVYEKWNHMCSTNSFFSIVVQVLQHHTKVNHTPFLDYSLQDGWLYKMDLLDVTNNDAPLTLLCEAHSLAHGGRL